MDTRPWRLELPPGIAWFEVDQADVVSAKRTVLKRVGAQLDVTATGKRPLKYPLKAASWRTVVADLQVPGWSQGLLAAGLDPTLPTVWLAEGLLYYLEPHTVPVMLQEASSLSGPNSVLLSVFVMEARLAQLKAERAAKLAAEGSTPRKPRDPRQGNVMDNFKWGCPENITQFWESCGWQPLTAMVWTEVSRDVYGYEAAHDARAQVQERPRYMFATNCPLPAPSL